RYRHERPLPEPAGDLHPGLGFAHPVLRPGPVAAGDRSDYAQAGQAQAGPDGGAAGLPEPASDSVAFVVIAVRPSVAGGRAEPDMRFRSAPLNQGGMSVDGMVLA